MTATLSLQSLPFDMTTLPDGWFSKAQVNMLFQLASMTRGPILEIGPWIGRSTCVICEAIIRREQKVDFDTVDYFISSEEEWRERFGSSVRRKPNADRYLAHINRPGGAIESFKESLTERGFIGMVNVHKGDFLEIDFGRRYGLIFCDATHNLREIEKNVPTIATIVLPGGYLAFDDIRTDEMEDAIRQHIPFRWWQNTDGLFFGQV